MPPKLRRGAGPRAEDPTSVSPLSGSEVSPFLPGDASPVDDPISALRRDLEVQNTMHREDTADLRTATVAMSQLLWHMASVPPAAPVPQQPDLVARMQALLNETALAD